jgi:outer membrane murein-binding lipoprotein Lpp
MNVRNLLIILAVVSLILVAGCDKTSTPSTTGEVSSEEQAVSDGLDDLDELNQMDQEANDVSFDELDNVDLG